MGNQLVGVAPSQIFPVEHYLSDHNDLIFDQSLGSTRFFKVARAKSREGLLVVKVFAIHDPTLPLAIHRERLHYIKQQLANAVNCLPFQKVLLTDKAGFIMREYVKYNLYDRMSTRPFLTQLEKKWITFQLLYALHQCHKLGICHGDIKLENIMLTSWSWLLLTDFASFKPTFLPEDNPADYSYFFDTSRRRVCYIAPERFVRTIDNQHRLQGLDDKGLLLSESHCKAGDLTPNMDVFSAGCALLELWNDGNPALDLSELLSYRNKGDRPNTMKLTKDSDTRLCDLLVSMTELNPNDRKSAEIYLANERGKLFPEYFYSFLQSYMLIFSAHPILPPDEKIHRIQQDIDSVIKILRGDEDDSVQGTETDGGSKEEVAQAGDGFKIVDIRVINKQDTETASIKPPRADAPSPQNDGLILITSLVTSCIRGLHHCRSKLNTLKILLQLCENCSSEIILDRIMPYIIFLTHDPLSRVRVAALNTLTECCQLMDRLPHNDTNVFPEYIFPEIASRATDNSIAVRQAYANNIGILAETSLRFLDDVQSVNIKANNKLNYESELAALHEMVRATVSSLLTDSQASVRRALVENGIIKLCKFFGKQKANDVILSHVVTFLNDKEETALRACFFDCIVSLTSYVGAHCASILLPLLQQGFTDQSEFVIAKALRATSSLAELMLLQKPTLCEIIAESVCYLAHPNIWIRHEICGLISTVACLSNPIDVSCKIIPLVWPYLKHKLTQVDKPELLLECLVDPIPRNVFDIVMKYKDINQLIETFRERRATRLKVKQGTLPQYSETGNNIKNLFTRLTSDGLTDHMESQILAMSTHLIKIKKASSHANNQSQPEYPGKLILTNTYGLGKSVNLDVNLDMPTSVNDTNFISSSTCKRTRGGSVSSHQSDDKNTSDWNHMSDISESRDALNVMSSSTPVQAASHYHHQISINSVGTQLSNLADQSIQERSFVQYNLAPCRIELRNLTMRIQQKYNKSLVSRDTSVESCDYINATQWKPGNHLFANLHEHTASVNKIVNLSSNSTTKGMFASCSNDGTIKLWDLNKIENGGFIHRSRLTFDKGGGAVVSMTSCENGQSLAASTQDGTIFVMRLDGGSSRSQVTQSRQLDMAEGVQIACSMWSDHIVYATLYSQIVGWDLRAPGNSWKLQGELLQGVITCMYMNSEGWMATGTSRGVCQIWDLRFMVPVTTIKHPYGERIRRVVSGGDSKIWTCGGRDASGWCCESAQRTHALLPYSQSNQSVSAVYAGRRGNCNFVITGGFDHRIRYWDTTQPDNSHVLVNSYNDPFKLIDDSVQYRTKLKDDTTFVQEVCKLSKNQVIPTSDDNIYKLCNNTSYHHTAAITDLSIIKCNKYYLISSAQDGAVNVWK